MAGIEVRPATEDADADRPAETPSGLGVVVTHTGVVAPVLGGTEGDWLVGTPCGAAIQLSGGTHVSGTTVLIDPGHGGSEPGAMGPAGTRESHVNYDIAVRLQQWLADQGIAAALTRTGDYYLTLGTRADIARALQPSLMVSVHHNSAPVEPSAGPGTVVFHQHNRDESARLAALLFEELVALTSGYDVAWIGGNRSGAQYRLGPEGTDFYGMLRNVSPIAAALTEPLYMNNAPEEQLTLDANFRQLEAEALGRGIARWLTTTDQGTGLTGGDQLAPWPGADTGGADQCQEPAL